MFSDESKDSSEAETGGIPLPERLHIHEVVSDFQSDDDADAEDRAIMLEAFFYHLHYLHSSLVCPVCEDEADNQRYTD